MKNNIKRALVSANMTQKELAEKVGMTEVGMSKAINGSATKTTLQRVAQALDVEVDSLVVEEPLHYAKYSAEKTPLKLGSLEIPCYVLENGMRVFSGRGIQKALGYESKSGQWMKSFCNLDGLSTYLNAEKNNIVEQMMNPINFARNNAGGSQSATSGFDATLLIDICSAIIDANRAGDFNDSTIVTNADIIIRAVAKVGIIALVDEATGYDKEKGRAKDELQKFLSQFLYEEAAKWVKTFDDTFFEDIYKMRGWTWTNTSKRPGVVGNWIKDIVYNRLAPISPKLEQLNPSNGHGQRRYKHHQFLSDDVAKPKLNEHLAVVHAFAVASNYNWERFMDLLNRAKPAYNTELFLDLDID